jgi:polyferredoxin
MMNDYSDLQEQLRSARKGRRDPLAAPKTDFAPEPKSSRWLILVALLAALTLIAIVLGYVIPLVAMLISYVTTIPPSHLLIIAVAAAFILRHVVKGAMKGVRSV